MLWSGPCLGPPSRVPPPRPCSRPGGGRVAGADVLYAPGLREIDDIRTVCAETDRPINVLLVRGGPTPAAPAEAGVARISVGGAFAWTALAGLIEAARELRDGGAAFLDRAAAARPVVDSALG